MDCPMCDDGKLFVWYYPEDGEEVSFNECDSCGYMESR